MQGTIKSVTKNGVFQELGKYYVDFNHSQGEKVLFFSKSEPEDDNFPLKVGTQINYELKPNGNGKILREDNFTKGFNKMPMTKKMDFTSISIISQVCYKANKDVFGKEYNDKVMDYTEADTKAMVSMINKIYEETQ